MYARVRAFWIEMPLCFHRILKCPYDEKLFLAIGAIFEAPRLRPACFDQDEQPFKVANFVRFFAYFKTSNLDVAQRHRGGTLISQISPYPK